MNLELPPEGHLQPEELAELVERTRQSESVSGPRPPGSPLGPHPPGWFSDLHPHLAQCLSCLERVRRMVAFDAQFEDLKASASGASGPDCPAANVWREIVAA